MHSETDAATERVIERINRVLDGITDIKTTDARDQALRALIVSAIDLGRLLAVQKAVFGVFMPEIVPHQQTMFDPATMEDVGGEDEETLSQRDICCVTFPGIMKRGDETGRMLAYRNIIAKATTHFASAAPPPYTERPTHATATALTEAGSIEVMQPVYAWTAVVRGAVLRGLEGSMVISRKARMHYGTSYATVYDDEKHSVSERYWSPLWERWMVSDRMQWHIAKGEAISPVSPIAFHYTRNFRPGQSLVVTDDLIACEADEPPVAYGRDLVNVCTLTTDLNAVPRSLFTRLTTTRGVEFDNLDFTLEMIVDSAGLGFELKVDGGTGKSNKIVITNDKGRLSKEEIERMLAEAEKYKEEDEAEGNRVSAKNGLESYAYSLRNTLSDPKVEEKLDESDKTTLTAEIDKCVAWLDENQQATKEEYEDRQKELEGVANPIMMKFYGAGGAPGGMPGGMPGGAPGGPGGPGATHDDGPTVEEVD
ncbi:hypothetical protein BN1708_016625, partial [Verticillium longisporum]